jgi:hypothetical protein
MVLENLMLNGWLKIVKKPGVSILAFILLACPQVNAQAITEASGEVDYFTDSGFSNTVGTMQHPAGEYYEGVTYVAYQGPLEDPYVAAYDHESGTWAGPFKAGESIMGKDPDHKIDNHGKPALIVDSKGYIHLVFGGHGGLPEHGENLLGNTHYGKMIHVVTKRPQDISEWKVLDNITPFGTYSQFVKMDNGDIYLFYRHGAHESNWVYQRSSDNGRSFGPKISILKHQVRTDTPGIHDSWYAWFTNGQGKDIIVTYNYHLHRESKHNGQRHNGYYMVMDTKDHEWRNVKGEKLTLPVTKDYADEMTLVVDTGDLWSARGTTALDPAGKPHVTLEVGEGMGLHHGGPKQTHHYRWTGTEWYSGGSTALPISSVGDMQIFSPLEVSLLLGGDEVAWWHSFDGGESFTKGKTLISRERTRFSITSMIRNAHPGARVMAAGNNRAEKDLYREMYLLGDYGPIKRPAEEAHHE